MKANWTPGPWVFAEDNQRDIHYSVSGELLASVYPIYHHDVTPGDDEANARLIAAAPEMARLLASLPLESFGDDMAQHDAADFVDHAGQFFEVMIAAKRLLAKLGTGIQVAG